MLFTRECIETVQLLEIQASCRKALNEQIRRSVARSTCQNFHVGVAAYKLYHAFYDSGCFTRPRTATTSSELGKIKGPTGNAHGPKMINGTVPFGCCKIDTTVCSC